MSQNIERRIFRCFCRLTPQNFSLIHKVQNYQAYDDEKFAILCCLAWHGREQNNRSNISCQKAKKNVINTS